MAIVETHPEEISGPWVEGFVLDKHVISSTPIGHLGDHMQFDTVRTALGELVYRFKNKGGPTDDIVHTASDFAVTRWPSRIDFVMSVPPSVNRSRQPGAVLAEGIAAALKVPILANDLWETGSTISRVAEIVRAMGAEEVRALVMTRTK